MSALPRLRALKVRKETFEVPEDFDRMGEAKIVKLFEEGK